LKNIAERARILGGTWKIDSAPGRGTRVEVVVKLP
jgi:signal transduction histidine kinase